MVRFGGGPVRGLKFFDIAIQYSQKLFRDILTHQRFEFLPTDVDLGNFVFGFARLKPGQAWETERDVGMAGFTGAVDDTAHDGDTEARDILIFFLPGWEFFLNVGGNFFRQSLKKLVIGTAAAGAADDSRGKETQVEGLENQFTDFDFAGATRCFVWRERDADSVANPLLKQDGERGAAGDNALIVRAGFCETEMESVEMFGLLHAGDKKLVSANRFRDISHFDAQNDLVLFEAEFFSEFGGLERAFDHGATENFAIGFWNFETGVFIHQVGK